MTLQDGLRKVSTSISSSLEDTLDECMAILEEHGSNPDSEYDTHCSLCAIIDEFRDQLNEIEEEVLDLSRNKPD